MTSACWKPSFSKKRGLEGEGEEALEAEPAGLVDAGLHHQCPQADGLTLLAHGQGTDLGQVFPYYVKGDAAEDLVAAADDEEVAQVLVDLAHGTGQHLAPASEGVDEVMHLLGVGRPRLLGDEGLPHASPRPPLSRPCSHHTVPCSYNSSSGSGARRQRSRTATRS